jgi:hypothetical protein
MFCWPHDFDGGEERVVSIEMFDWTEGSRPVGEYDRVGTNDLGVRVQYGKVCSHDGCDAVENTDYMIGAGDTVEEALIDVSGRLPD